MARMTTKMCLMFWIFMAMIPWWGWILLNTANQIQKRLQSKTTNYIIMYQKAQPIQFPNKVLMADGKLMQMRSLVTDWKLLHQSSMVMLQFLVWCPLSLMKLMSASHPWLFLQCWMLQSNVHSLMTNQTLCLFIPHGLFMQRLPSITPPFSTLNWNLNVKLRVILQTSI